MSCGSEFETSSCICDTLLAIVEAQDLVKPDEETLGKGCERAINELNNGKLFGGYKYNTIPIMLTVFNTGKLFEGHGTTKKKGKCYFVESKIFRIDNVDSDSCCATLELLKKKDHFPKGIDSDDHHYENHKDDYKDNHKEDHYFEELEGTDAYITVDLKMFGAVTCLCPVAIHHDCK
ncbi:hypothetical protein F7984_11000 [Pradoshia sp. D12]|uniref:CotY/CotZ family spore coat protein n=1 Tax=Bacillaceae TaxID=186817 RepID=UPI00080AE4B9|nr:MULTISPECIES: CotY/CotZ family spore coat protein [Bacillaceae]OCA83477.1 hypothetical protein A8L44_11625 [Bacillus sp. FJAT-27986]QFK71718.1 hypothetical protein F7984_11000 [Pradoshia sp. D12]TPF73513.1 hypothetical protein FHY44_07400 [Bacillus sp. D12]